MPLWFAPLQVVVATITQEADPYAEQVAKKLKAAGLQVETDLRNDHPVGLQFPGDSPDFNGGTVDFGKLRFFDSDGDGRPDPDEVRFYDTGEGFEVECASCHDPHGVPSNGPGSTFNPTFLRIANAGSSLCLSCHIK